MTTSPLYCNDLTLSPCARVIPYPADRQLNTSNQPVSQRIDPSINYGFKNLKIKPSLIETIPELAEDLSLKSLVQSLNKGESSFFTVGCASQLIRIEGKHRREGYLAFAWNCAGCIQDAVNYFALYFHFEKSLREQNFNQPVRFKWIVQESAFLDAKLDGFSCAIHIETRSLSSPEQANQAWQFSLRMLESYFAKVFAASSTPLYKPLSEYSSELSS